MEQTDSLLQSLGARMIDNLLDIKSLTKDELTLKIKEMGEPGFRAGQIYDWIHKKQAASFDEMTNISKAGRERLKEMTNL